MSYRKFSQEFVAGAFVQTTDGPASSLTGLNVTSATVLTRVTVGSDFIGNTTIRGINNITSGTTVVSVSATGVASGDVIIATIYNRTGARNSGQAIALAVESIRSGAFEIVCAGSAAPNDTMPVAWFRVDI